MDSPRGRSRETADPALESLKMLCGLNPQDRQGRQQGTFAAEYDRPLRRHLRLARHADRRANHDPVRVEEDAIQDLDELGMRAKLQEEFRQSLGLTQGFVLLSAMPGGGLRSTTDVVLRSATVLPASSPPSRRKTNRYQEVENIPVTTYKAADGQSPADVLPKFFRTEPKVAVVRDLVDGETVSMMCEEIAENRLMIGTIRAKDSPRRCCRCWRWACRRTSSPRRSRRCSASGWCASCARRARRRTPRRRKCSSNWGFPRAASRRSIARPSRTPTSPRRLASSAGRIGYFGRTAVFELLTVGDAVRKGLTPNPSWSAPPGRPQDGMKSLQEEGVLLVAKGVTSLPELMRVLKQ